MFREIRKKRNEISPDMAKQLLAAQRRGVLAVLGDDGYPYAIPINYIYSEEDGKIYFHGSRAGHRVDAIKRCDKVCFTVYGNALVKEEAWAPYVQSVVVFGRCRMITDQDYAIELVRRFAAKYYPDMKLVDQEISRSGRAVQMFEIEIEHLSVKKCRKKK